MKKCRDVENLLPLYPEGALSESERRVVEDHLAECAVCRKELAYLQKAGKLVNQLSPIEEPPWFQQKIMARVREEAARKGFVKKWFYPLRIKIPVQVAATIVIAVLAVYLYRSGNEQVKEIMPGLPPPAAEMQTPRVPALSPETGDRSLSSRRPGQEATVRQESRARKPVARGGRESAVPADSPDEALGTDALRARGSAESKDDAAAILPGKSGAPESMEKQRTDQRDKAGASAAAKKTEAYKMTAPAAPQSTAEVDAPQARVLVRVGDLPAAAAEVEKILVRYGARNISRQPAAGVIVIRADLPGKHWEDLLAGLKEMGAVSEKILPADRGEKLVRVLIEMAMQ